ncbi:hypothetical protein BU15DRAFT_62755 [Melanogaster broomeanus]|nr:hypothetical protein BU15DRAFT_62755 [Melanogaster broomeanus]
MATTSRFSRFAAFSQPIPSRDDEKAGPSLSTQGLGRSPTHISRPAALAQRIPSGDDETAGPSLSTQGVDRSLTHFSRLAALTQPIPSREDEKVAVLKDFEKAAAKVHADRSYGAGRQGRARREGDMAQICAIIERGRTLGIWSKEIMRREEDAARIGEEERACSPMQEDAPIHAPSTSTRAGPQRSMEVVITSRRKRSRQDFEEEDKETTAALPEGMVVHDNPCAKCAAKGHPCRGTPKRACEACTVHKVACEKSSLGRSRAADKKGKALAVPSVDDDDDDSATEEPKEKGKTKTSAASSKTEISKAQLELYMQNIVKCEAKIRTSQGRLKKAEAELNEAMSDLGGPEVHR